MTKLRKIILSVVMAVLLFAVLSVPAFAEINRDSGTTPTQTENENVDKNSGENSNSGASDGENSEKSGTPKEDGNTEGSNNEDEGDENNLTPADLNRQANEEIQENTSGGLLTETNDETVVLDSDTGRGTDISSVNNPLEPNKGSAEIIEYYEYGNTDNKKDELSGTAGDGLETTNDVPSLEHVVYINEQTNEEIEDFYQREDNQATVEIDTSVYPLPKNQKTTTQPAVGGVKTEITTYTSTNAIEKAIQNVLTRIGDKAESATIKISEGIYDGDITISSSIIGKSSSIWENFTLYLLAEDSYEKKDTTSELPNKDTISCNGSGIAKVTGKLTISGINTVIAGLYFDTDEAISITNSRTVIYGTTSDDNIEISAAGTKDIKICTGEGNDEVSLQYLEKLIPDTTQTGKTIDVELGEGDDILNVDVNLANSAVNSATTTVNARGNDGKDILNIIGTLLLGGTNDVKLNGSDIPTIKLINAKEKIIDIKAHDFESYIDSLENKPQVNITEGNVQNGKIKISPEKLIFVDYYLDTSKGAFKNGDNLLDIEVGTAANSLLATLKIKSSGTLNIGNISAPGLNINLSGVRYVLKNGKTISGANVEITITEDRDKELKVGDDSELFKCGLFSAQSYFVAEENSKIESTGSVIIRAKSVALGGFIPVGGLNPIVVKVGSAYVELNGTINAHAGNVKVDTDLTIEANAKNTLLANLYVPISVNVSVAKSYITLSSKGSICAAGSVMLKSKSYIDIGASSVTGALPISLALSVLSNNTYVKVDGKIHAANGDIILDANADATVSAIASTSNIKNTTITVDDNGYPTGESAGASSVQYAMFFSLTATKQKCYVLIDKNAELTAEKGNIIINNSSILDTVSSARSAAAKVSNTSDETSGIESTLYIIETKIFDLVGTYFGEVFPQSDSQKELTDIKNNIISKYGYEITADASDHGTVSTVGRANAGDVVNVNVTPDQGYTVDYIEMKYLNPSKKWIVNRLTPLSDNNNNRYYAFTMPTANVCLTVMYRVKAADDPEIKNRSSAQGTTGVAEALEAATETNFKPGTYGYDHKINEYGSDTIHGYISANTNHADVGQTIRVLVQPEAGYSIKPFSLKAVYNNGYNKLVSETLYADANGEYFYTVSNNIRAASDITFEAEFETTQAPIQNENRVVGAIALSVNINEGSAVIDINKTITAAGDLLLDSTVISRNYTIADASAIKQNVAVQTETLSGIDETKRYNNAQKHSAQTPVEKTVAGRETDDPLYVKINGTVAGTVSFASEGLQFVVTAEQGYRLKQIQLIAKGKNGVNLTYNLVENNGYYGISTEDKVNFSEWEKDVEVTAIFEGAVHSISNEGTPPEGIEVIKNARTGDTVYISLDGCDPGKTVNITFKDSATKNEISIVTETVDNRVIFAMPDKDITLYITAATKENRIVIDNNSKDYISAQSYAGNGETIKVKASEKLILEGKNYVIKYTVGTDTYEHVLDINGELTVPQNAGTVTLKVEIGLNKEIEFDYSKLSQGGAIRGPLYVNRGQYVELYVIPATGYKLSSDGIELYIPISGNAENITVVKADAEGRYFFTVPVDAYIGDKIAVQAKFEQTEEKARQDNVPQFAAGAAVAVSIITSTNDVAIKNGTINVNGLELTATNGILKDPTINSSTATAGYSQGRLGIAGALEIDVANVKSNAWVAEPVLLNIGTGNLKVEATAYTALTSLAEAAQPTAGRDASQGSGSYIGAGAGTAISVANISSVAQLCDGLRIIQKKNAQDEVQKINSITINADSMAIHTTAATAGSAGWNAGSATLLVLTEGVKSYAMLGSAPAIDKAIFLDVANDINVVSATAATRTANATGTAAGAAGVVGADMVVSVYKDSAESYHKRNTRSKNLTVSATSNSMAVGVAFAGTFGAPSGNGEDEEGAADAEASRAANIAAILAGKLGTGNMDGAEISDQIGNRQKAQTGEGSFGLAAAFVVICEKNIAIAEIVSGLTIVADEMLMVSSSTKSDIYNYAIATAVGCNLGVGAAAAVSTIRYTNHALIGDSNITAGMLYVTASVGKPAYNIAPSIYDKEGKTNILSQYVYKLFHALSEKMFKNVAEDTRNKISDVIADVLSSVSDVFTKELIKGTGLENLLATDIEAKITQRLGEIPTSGTLENVVKNLRDFIVNEILKLIQNSFTADDNGAKLNPEFLPATQQNLTEDLKKLGRGIASDVFSGIIDFNKFLDFIMNVKSEDLLNRLINALKASGKRLTSKTIDAVLEAAKITSDKGTEAFLYNFMDTEAISGAGSSKIGVAGSLAIGVLDGDTIARISGHSGDNSVETITVYGITSISADDYQRIITIGSAAADKDGYADPNASQGEASDVGSNSDTDSEAGKAVWNLEAYDIQNGTIRFTDKNGATIDKIKPGSDIYVVLTPETGYTFDRVFMDGVSADYEFNKVGGNTLILVAPDYTEGKDSVRINVAFRKLNQNENKLVNDEAINDYGKGVGVGGSFTLNVVKPTVKAELGSRKVTTGAIQISAYSISGVDTIATSGTDVLSRTTSLSKNTACDAAVSVCDVDKVVFAGTTGACDITTIGGNIILVNPLDTSDNPEMVNVLIYAAEEAKTTTKASGVAVGAQSAVGATVAVNVSNSDVNVSIDGTINAQSAENIAPDVLIYTTAKSADRTYATATANGADMDRLFNKIGAKKELVQSILDKIAKGDFSELRKKQQENQQDPVQNQTSYTILDVLSKHKDDAGEDGSTGAPVSSNVLSILKAQTDAANSDAIEQGLKEVKDAADAANEAENSKKTSVQIAAAVAAGISNHKLKTRINGSITGNTIALYSANDANFITRAFASTMTGTEKSNGVAAGVAVSVNKNEAINEISGNLTAKSFTTAEDTTGQMTISSTITQNTDKDFINALAAQATAGAVAGEDGRFTISGALAILRTKAKAAVYISNNSELIAINPDVEGSSGGNVIISAYDKSKIGMRAGGISKSTGAAIGAGASFALLYDNNDAEVIIGTATGTKNSVGENEYDASKVIISGRNVYITSVKKEVTIKDYVNPFPIKFLVTKDAVEDADKGILNLKQNSSTKEYTVEINISTDKVLEAMNVLNFAAYDNYYLEAICGQINNGEKSDLSLAGSVALMFYHANTRTVLGNGIIVTANGDMDVYAIDQNTAVLVAGSLSVSPAKMGVGVTISSIDDHAVVYACLGNNAKVNANSYCQIATNLNELVVVSIAATIGKGTDVKYNVGGIVNVTNMQNKVYNLVGNNASITTAGEGNIDVVSINKGGLALIAIATTGINGKTAGGGTINALVIAPVNKTLIGTGAKLNSAGSMTISADTLQKVLNIMGAGAPAYKSDISAAATIGVFITSAETKALIGDNAELTAGNDIEIRAKSEISAINLDIVVSVADKTSIGGAVVVDVFKNRVNAETGKNAHLTSYNGSVSIIAYAYDWNVLVAEATGASKGLGITGVICTTVYNSAVMAVVGEGTEITAEDSISVIAVLDSNSYTAAGGVTILRAKSELGIGATVASVVNTNRAEAIVNSNAKLTAYENGTNGVQIPNRQQRRKGIVIYSVGDSDVVNVAIAAAAGLGQNSAAGVVNTLVLKGTYNTYVAKNASVKLTARDRASAGTNTGSSANSTSGSSANSDNSDADDPDPAVYIEAHLESLVVQVTDDVVISRNIGAGGIISTLVFNYNVSAKLDGNAETDRDINVLSYSYEKVVNHSLALSGGKNGVGGNINTLVTSSSVCSEINGTITRARNVNVQADNSSKIYTINHGISGGLTNSGTAVVMVTTFKGTSQSIIFGSVTGVEKQINVKANGNEFITVDTVGGAGAAALAGSGAIDVAVSNVTVKALIAGKLSAGDDINILATNIFELIGVVEYVSVSGKAAIGGAILVVVENDTVLAAVEENASVSGRNINVKAENNKDVLTVSGSVAGAGGAGFAATVTVVVSGGKMTQSAHDSIYETGLNPQKSLETSLESSRYLNGYNPGVDLNLLLDGDEQKDAFNKDLSHLGNEEGSATKIPGDSASDASTGTDEFYRIEDSELPSDDKFDTDYTVNPATFGSTIKSTIVARVAKNAKLTATNDITISAQSKASILVVAGSVGVSALPTGGGLGVGAGVGFAVVVTNITVDAYAASGSVLNAGNTVTIRALSGVSDKDLTKSENVSVVENSDISEAATIAKVEELDTELKINANRTQNRIRLIGYAGAVGISKAGVGFNGGIFIVHDQVRAIEAGAVKAKNLNVQAVVDYRKALAVSAGVSGGNIGVNVSLAVVYFGEKVECGVSGDAVLDISETTSVQSDIFNNVQTASGNLAAGKYAGAVGISIGVNKATIYTYIGQGVSGSSKNIIVSHNADTTSKVYIINASFGEFYGGASVAVNVNKLRAFSYIGYENGYAADDSKGAANKIVSTGTVSVLAVSSGEAYNRGVACAGGVAGGNGIVCLAFNIVTNRAYIANKQLELNNVNVEAILTGDVKVYTHTINPTGVGGGLTIAVGKQKSENRAIFDFGNTTVNITGSLLIGAGRDGSTSTNKKSSSTVIVDMFAFSVNGAGGGLNFAVALNTADNQALLLGRDASGKLTIGKDLTIRAIGNSRAYTDVAAFTIGAAEIGVSLCYAKLNSVQQAKMDTAGSVEVKGNVVVQSIHNAEIPAETYSVPYTSVKIENGNKVCTQKTLTVKREKVTEAVFKNGNVSGASVTAGIVLAKSNATSNAVISAALLDVNGSITVANTAVAGANSSAETIDASLASIGIAVVHSYSEGTFKAEIISGGNITAKNGISVTNTYDTQAVAVHQPCGVSVNVAEIKVNTSYAETKTMALADIRANNSGIVSSGSNILVKNFGYEKALAEIQSRDFSMSVASVLVGVAKAITNGTQEAYIRGAEINANNVSVENYYNVPKNTSSTNSNFSPAEGCGATAIVGSSATNISGAEIKANVARAKANPTVNTCIETGAMTVSGTVTIHTGAYSTSKADCDKPHGTASIVSIPIYVTKATSNGTYKSYLQATAQADKSISVSGGIRVSNYSRSKTESYVLALGGIGNTTELTGAKITVNAAIAKNEDTFISSFTGNGTVNAGSLTVHTKGNTVVTAGTAENTDKNVNLSLLRVAGTEAKAYLDSSYKAATSFTGNAVFTGDVTVLCDTNNLSESESGNARGVSLSVISGSGENATSYLKAKNYAQMEGTGGKITVGGNLLVKAVNSSNAKAEVAHLSEGAILTVQVYLADVRIDDTVEAGILSGNLVVKGTATVDSQSKADSKAIGVAGNTVAVIAGNGGSAHSNIGENGGEIIKAYVKGNIEADGNISINARNEANNLCKMNGLGKNVGIIGIRANNVKTKTTLQTYVDVGDNVSLISNNGTITINAYSYSTGEARVNGDCVGVVFSADEKRAYNYVTETARITIGRNSTVKANGNINIQSGSDVHLLAETNVNNGGLFVGGSAFAGNYLDRTVEININSGSKIISEANDINIKSVAGENDWAYAHVCGSKSALLVVNIKGFRAESTHSSQALINVYGNTEISAQKGNVVIQAIIATKQLVTDSHMDSKGAISTSYAYATLDLTGNQHHILKALVNIIGTSSSERAVIQGQKVRISAELGQLGLNAKAYSYAGGMGAGSHATVNVCFALDAQVIIENAKIIGPEEVYICADGTADNGSKVTLDALAEAGGAGLWVYSYARFMRDAKSNNGGEVKAVIRNNSSIYSGNIVIDSKPFTVTKDIRRDWQRHGVGGVSEEWRDDFQNTKATTFIEDGTEIMVFNMLGNKEIYIWDRWNNGKATVDTFDEQFTVVADIDNNKKTVTIKELKGNLLQGNLEIHNNTNVNGLKNCKTYYSYNVSNITFENSTNYDLIMTSIIPDCSGTSGVVTKFVNCANNDATFTFRESDTLDGTVSFIMTQGTNLTINDLILLEKGTLDIKWTGSKGGNLETKAGGIVISGVGTEVAPIWVHSLNVTGANNVGSEKNRLMAYLCVGPNEEEPKINIVASGNVYLQTALCDVNVYRDSLPSTVDKSDIGVKLNLQKVVAGGVADIEIDSAKRINYKANTKYISILSVGNTKLTDEWFIYYGKRTSLSQDDLILYYSKEESDETFSVYNLPNGNTIYIDNEGKIRRVFGNGGNCFDTSSYELINGIIHNKTLDLYINYSNGQYWLGENADIIVQNLEYRAENGIYITENLNGTIISRDYLYVYDENKEEIILANKETYTANGISDVLFKWISDVETDDEGWVAGFSSSNDTFVGIFRAKNNGSGEIELISALNPTEQTVQFDIEGSDEKQDITAYLYVLDMAGYSWYAFSGTDYYYQDSANSGTNIYSGIAAETYTQTVKENTIGSFKAQVAGLSFSGAATVIVSNVPKYEGTWSDSNKVIITLKKTSYDTTDYKNYYVVDELFKFATNGNVVDATADYYRTDDNVSFVVTYNPVTNYLRINEKWLRNNRYDNSGFEFDNRSSKPYAITGCQKLRYLNKDVVTDFDEIIYINEGEDWNLGKIEEINGWKVVTKQYGSDRKIYLVYNNDGVVGEVMYNSNNHIIELATLDTNNIVRRYYWDDSAAVTQVPTLENLPQANIEQLSFMGENIADAGTVIQRVEGSNVSILVSDPNAGIEGSSNESANVKATGNNGAEGNIIIKVDQAKYIGTKENPISVDLPKGELRFGVAGASQSFDAPVHIKSSGRVIITEMMSTQPIYIEGNGLIDIKLPDSNTSDLNVVVKGDNTEVKLENRGNINADIAGDSTLDVKSSSDIHVNAKSDSKLYAREINTDGDVYIDANHLMVNSIKTSGDVYIKVLKGALEPSTDNDIIECRNFTLYQARRGGKTVYIYVDEFISQEDVTSYKYSNIFNRKYRNSYENCFAVYWEDDVAPMDSSVSILAALFMNDIDIKYSTVLKALRMKPSEISPVFNSSTEYVKKYIGTERSKVKAYIANIENMLGVKSYMDSNAQAGTNYIESKKLGTDISDRYYESLFKLACIEILYGNYKEAWELLEICREMDSSYSEIYLMLALVCLYSNKPVSAVYYFNDYLRLAPDYNETIDAIVKSQEDQDKLIIELNDGYGYIFRTQNTDNSKDQEGSVSERLSMIVTCCLFDDETEMADKYLSVMEELDISFSTELLELMEVLEDAYSLDMSDIGELYA